MIEVPVHYAEISFNIEKHNYHSIMKNLLTFASIILLILSVWITYLGLQRESIVNPPLITGVGFIMIALVFITLRKQV